MTPSPIAHRPSPNAYFMKYYYLHPGCPRYFFPEGFQDHPLFFSFCRPYAKKAAISWWLFRNITPYRWAFSMADIEAFVPEKAIRRIVGMDALLAFNAGTLGPEQKTTALGWDGADYFFLKYAHTPLAVGNVRNEHEVLQRITTLDFVPRVLDFVEADGAVLLKTSVVQGGGIPAGLSPTVLDILDRLTGISIGAESYPSDGLRYGFAHGDFCPWNMVNQGGKVLVYDWEMAGNYPLGYDLFTYIFQTSFLLTPEKTIPEILSECSKMMVRYFEQLGVADWYRYIEAFAQAKADYIQTQGDKGLLNAYTRLLKFCREPIL